MKDKKPLGTKKQPKSELKKAGYGAKQEGPFAPKKKK